MGIVFCPGECWNVYNCVLARNTWPRGLQHHPHNSFSAVFPFDLRLQSKTFTQLSPEGLLTLSLTVLLESDYTATKHIRKYDTFKTRNIITKCFSSTKWRIWENGLKWHEWSWERLQAVCVCAGKTVVQDSQSKSQSWTDSQALRAQGRILLLPIDMQMCPIEAANPFSPTQLRARGSYWSWSQWPTAAQQSHSLNHQQKLILFPIWLSVAHT